MRLVLTALSRPITIVVALISVAYKTTGSTTDWASPHRDILVTRYPYIG